jgi:hypothetical protein
VSKALTRLVPLQRVQMEGSRSVLSPKEYGKGGPFAMADATADLRKSIASGSNRARATRLGWVEVAPLTTCRSLRALRLEGGLPV